MIGNSALRIVVGSDSLTSVTRAYLALPVRSYFTALLFLRCFQNSGTQHSHTFFSVLNLRFFVLALSYNAGRDMSHTYS